MKRTKVLLSTLAKDAGYDKSQKRLFELPEQWGGYFLSPTGKEARSLNKAFTFNNAGQFLDTPLAIETLTQWLNVTSGDTKNWSSIQNWLSQGTPLNQEVFRRIEKKLKEIALTPDVLYNHPIYRLVRRDQLHYDRAANAIYQLTPAACRLMGEEKDKSKSPDAGESLDAVRHHQSIFWNLSEKFQSAIAMFDSDLGGDEKNGQNKNVTREFIRVSLKGRSKINTTPQRLNRFSPLRYWAPAPAFVKCVFHMLFWHPIVTGKDLYGRAFPPEFTPNKNRRTPSAKELEDRAGFYYVARNQFQTAHYRIANYPEIAGIIQRVAEKLAKHSTPRTSLASTLPDLDLTNPFDDDEYFLATHFRSDQLFTKSDYKLSVSLPLKSLGADQWNLAPNNSGNTNRNDLLCFLRDRLVELILWAHYQMEIRSVGMVPIERLYRVKLTNPKDFEFKHEDKLKADILKLFEKNTRGAIGKHVELIPVFNRPSGKTPSDNSIPSLSHHNGVEDLLL